MKNPGLKPDSRSYCKTPMYDPIDGKQNRTTKGGSNNTP
jgi:hypothetical protein